MSDFPYPRGIRKCWAEFEPPAEIVRQLLGREVLWNAMVSGRQIVATRGWRIAHGKGRGQVVRIDMAMDDGEQMSLRVLARSITLRIGDECCR